MEQGLSVALLQFGSPQSPMQHFLQGFAKMLLQLAKFQVPQLVPSHMHKSIDKGG